MNEWWIYPTQFSISKPPWLWALQGQDHKLWNKAIISRDGNFVQQSFHSSCVILLAIYLLLYHFWYGIFNKMVSLFIVPSPPRHCKFDYITGESIASLGLHALLVGWLCQSVTRSASLLVGWSFSRCGHLTNFFDYCSRGSHAVFFLL